MWARARARVCMSNTRARGCVLRGAGGVTHRGFLEIGVLVQFRRDDHLVLGFLAVLCAGMRIVDKGRLQRSVSFESSYLVARSLWPPAPPKTPSLGATGDATLKAVGRAVNINRKSASEAERGFAAHGARGAAARHGTVARHGGAARRRAVRVARQGSEKCATH